MKLNKYNLRILRIGCHSLSNIAMEIQNCEILVNCGVIECILLWIEEYISDWRICWLACSSLWNLARCKLARDRINICGVLLVISIIDLHQHSPLVMQTSLGALSNLCIDSYIKKKIGNENMIKKCFNIMDKHPYDSKVLTSACGLLTNLAYDESIALNINSYGINKIVKCMNNHKKINHLQRNASAALSNLSATPQFIKNLCSCNGIEALFDALVYHKNDSDVTQLATGALQNLSIYGPTTSLHVASTYCNSSVIRHILLNNWNNFMNINICDIYGDTPLHSAIRSFISLNSNDNNNDNYTDRLDVIQFLIAYGASLNKQNKKLQSPIELIDSDIKNEKDKNILNIAINQGLRHLKIINKRFCNLIISIRKDIPIEIIKILSNYCHPLELSIKFRVELEPSFKLAKHSKHINKDNIHIINYDDCSDLMDVDL